MKSLYNLNIVNFSEIDKPAVASYTAIHGVSETLNLGDITKVDPKKLSKDITVLVGGSPCTNFSAAGLRSGSIWNCNNCGKKFDPLEIDDLDNCCCPDCKSTDLIKTESSLIVDWLRIFKEVNPKLAIFENVKNLLSKKFEHSFRLFESRVQSLGYNTYYKCMNAKDYGVPQNRERIIFLAIRKDVDNGKFKFPEPCGEVLTINDLLEKNLDIFKSTASNVIIDDKISPYLKKNVERDVTEIITSTKGIFRMKCTTGFNDNAVGIRFVPALRAKNSSTLALQTFNTSEGKKYYIKRLTPLEAFRFMGFDDEDYEKASKVTCKTQLYKQCGNSIVVPVVEKVLQELFKVMPELFEDVQIIDLFAGIGAFEKAFKRVIDDANAGYIVPYPDEYDVIGHCPICGKAMTEDNYAEFTHLYYQLSEEHICEDCITNTTDYDVCFGCGEDSFGCFIPISEMVELSETIPHTNEPIVICKNNADTYVKACEVCGGLYYTNHFDWCDSLDKYCCLSCCERHKAE